LLHEYLLPTGKAALIACHPVGLFVCQLGLKKTSDPSESFRLATFNKILLQAMVAPAGVIEMTTSLGISQPTVSGHLKVLLDAGLVQPQQRGGRSVFVASRKRVERLLEDARATIARWY
jgi:DNA-binding transcriptional ArsR family regulator